MSAVFDVVVTVATFRRPELLRSLLDSLQGQESLASTTFHTIVVDNDPLQSAERVVADYPGLATYICEPAPGIAAARNAALEASRQFSPSAIGFIDDDEVASPRWLSELLEVWSATGADVVTGPVRYDLPPGSELLSDSVQYFRTSMRENLSVVEDVATNNTLVTSTWFLAHPHLRFSESYSLTGGSDLELFYRLQKQGGSCVWAEKALVVETVPPNRAALAWVKQRDLRNGQLLARLGMERFGDSRSKVLLLGILRIVKGAAWLMLSRPGTSKRIQAWHVLQKGRGYARASLGRHYREYAVGRKTETRLHGNTTS